MKSVCSSLILFTMVFFAICTGLRAEDEQVCSKVTAEVITATEKTPQRVLVIVEDAIVANETCAGEIVAAAIRASKANEDLVKQIVITATNISPRQSAKIAESAAGAAPSNVAAVAEATKEAAGMQNPPPLTSGGKGSVPPVIPPVATFDYGNAPLDIRGVYLIQPAVVAVQKKQMMDCGCVDEQQSQGSNVQTTLRHPDSGPTPQSPSYASSK